MSSINIYAEHDDIVSVRVVGHEHRIKVGDAWLHLSLDQAKQLHAKLTDAGALSDDRNIELVITSTNVLRDLHTSHPKLVERACEARGLEIDWSDAPVEQEEGGTVIGPG